MTRRIGIADIAQLAGVSPATVDRVIHGRDGVSPKSAARVMSAIDELGYGKLPIHLQKSFLSHYRFGFLLPQTATEFVQDLEAQIRRIAEEQNNRKIDVEIVYADVSSERSMTRAIQDLGTRRLDAVAMFALDTAGVKSAMDRLVHSGTPVCTIVSDVPHSHRFAFIGQDNVVAGRTAGRLMGMQARGPGRVVIVTGSHSIRDQSARVFGFCEVLKDRFPTLVVSEVFEGASDTERNQEFLTELLNSGPKLAGLYCACGGRGGLISALRAVDPQRRPVTIFHELTQTSQAVLAEGLVDAVIHQSRTRIVSQCLEAMCRKMSGRDWPPRSIPTEIYLTENIP